MNWTQEQFDAAMARIVGLSHGLKAAKEVKRDTNPNDRRNLIGADPEPAPVRKYRNVTKEVDGIVFDSCKEAKVYLTLKYRQQAGEITCLKLQPHYLLQEPLRDAQGKKHRKIEYYGDFSYIEWEGNPHKSTEVCVEVKGYDTPTWRIKQKLFLAKFPHIRLEVIK